MPDALSRLPTTAPKTTSQAIAGLDALPDDANDHWTFFSEDQLPLPPIQPLPKELQISGTPLRPGAVTASSVQLYMDLTFRKDIQMGYSQGPQGLVGALLGLQTAEGLESFKVLVQFLPARPRMS